MKKLIKYISILGVIIISFTACELTTPIDEIELKYQLDAETAINNESSANLALAGAYASLREGPIAMLAAPEFLAGSAESARPDPEMDSWEENQPLVDEENETTINNNGMSQLYRAINDANWIIEKVSELDDGAFTTPGRRTQILGEAYGLRGMAHFFLLRYWGQWYDDASEYGIALRLEPIRDGIALPRNSVADTYTQVHSDLDFAVANARDIMLTNERVYMTKLAARALKAKAYLCQGEYAMAASTAKAILDEAGADFSLSPSFNAIFDHTEAMFSNPEVLFGLKGTNEAALALGWGFWYGFNGAFINNLTTGTSTIGSQTINWDSNRVASTTFSGFFGVENLKRDTFGDAPDMVHYARLAEVYLIFAEADARANNSVTTDALDALNAIRIRAGAVTTGGDGFETYPATITLDEFIEAVRIEKMVELNGEQGEVWFDLVRYDWEDGFGSGFQVSDHKPTATDPNKFIFPIPPASVEAGGNVEVQNPSY